MKSGLVVLALVLAAAPLSAQARTHVVAKIPPGQLPPKGMCRVWIDGVPPGQQPPVTNCATALANRVPNSRVIFGDRESFPGRGKNTLKTEAANGEVGRTCSVWDAVVVDGRLVNVCRDDVVLDKRGRKIRREDLDHEDDKVEKTEKTGKVKGKGIKANKKGKHGDDGDDA